MLGRVDEGRRPVKFPMTDEEIEQIDSRFRPLGTAGIHRVSELAEEIKSDYIFQTFLDSCMLQALAHDKAGMKAVILAAYIMGRRSVIPI